MLEQILHFKGTWRSYQQRVLDKYDRYSQDRKIHIVAAPGFRVIIVTVANSLGNIRVFELLPKLKTKKYGWCIA